MILVVAPAVVGCGSSGSSDIHDAREAGVTEAGGSETGGDSATARDGVADTGSDSGAAPAADAGADAADASGARTVGTFAGVNALITDKVADLAPIGVVREYHNWGWLGNNYSDSPYPQTLYTPDIPSFGWDWDGFFAGLKAAGVSGFPAVQGGAPWVSASAVPPATGSPTAAASYVAHGDTMFQIAARWGKSKVDDAKLKLEADQTRESGLGTVAYFEDFNEEDNASGFTGDVFAAMASADYDGDEGRLGATIGVKNADPTAKLVMGGLSGQYGLGSTWSTSITTFLDAARTWSAAHRTDGTFATDVVNVHYYSFGPGSPAPALSPEDDNVRDKLTAIMSYSAQHLPGKPVWWTEFGYDTYSGSSLHAPALGSNSAAIVQGQWLVRELLAALAAGIDRATVFELDDTCTPPAAACNTQFATAGLLTLSGTRKPAWYFLSTFRARLKDYAYTRVLPSGDTDVNVAEFNDTAGAGGAWVLWMGTSTAATRAAFSLPLPAGVTSAKAVALVDGQANGVETTLTPSNGAITLDVTETPTLVLYSP